MINEESVCKKVLRYQHPSIFELYETEQELGFFEWCIKLTNGSKFLYVPRAEELLVLPKDVNDPSEQTFKMLVGRRLRIIMRDRGINRLQLSEMTGISLMSIGRYINGSRTPSGYALRKFAKALNCSVDDFFYNITV